jgi:hypothetical protein
VLPWAARSIPRRFSSGVALINDGLRHSIYYWIAERHGHDRHGLGRQFLRGRARSQLGVRTALPRGEALRSRRRRQRTPCQASYFLSGILRSAAFVSLVVGLRFV